MAVNPQTPSGGRVDAVVARTAGVKEFQCPKAWRVFPHGDFNLLCRFAFALPERELDGFAHSDLLDLFGQVRETTGRSAVCGHDDVPQFSGRGIDTPQPGARSRRARNEAAFPESTQSILVVLQAPTPELANAAERAVVGELANRSDAFQSVIELGGGEFFERSGLLFLPTAELKPTTDKLATAAPLIQVLAADPSLRGLLQGLSFTLAGVQAEQISLDDASQRFDMVAQTLENVLVGRPAYFSWKTLWSGQSAGADERRRLISIWAKLNYSELEPGERATTAIRDAAERAKLASDFDANLRLTGPVPIADTEFATLQEGAAINAIISTITVLLILWLALRWMRLVLVVAVTLAVGLAMAGGLGLLLVGALNPISVAFAVLFVGLGADFAIQFSVRYRADRHDLPDLHQALIRAARRVGRH
jgi:hypothetical protein